MTFFFFWHGFAGEVRGAGCCWDWCVEESKAGGERIEKERRGKDSLGMARFCRRGIEWSGESRTAWMAGMVGLRGCAMEDAVR